MSAKVANTSKENDVLEFQLWMEDKKIVTSDFIRPNELEKLNIFSKAMENDDNRLSVLVEKLDTLTDKSARFTIKTEIVAKNVSIGDKMAWITTLYNRLQERAETEKVNTAMLEISKLENMEISYYRKLTQFQELQSELESLQWDMAHLENMRYDMINASDKLINA